MKRSPEFYVVRGVVIFMATAFGAGIVSGACYLVGQPDLGWWVIVADLAYVLFALACVTVWTVVSSMVEMWKSVK